MTKILANPTNRITVVLLLVLVLGQLSCTTLSSQKGGSSSKDPYASYVWPPPPDKARIRLADIYYGREDVESSSALGRALLGATPGSPYEHLVQPTGVAFDREGRVIVSETIRGALFRFDKAGKRMDVFGTTGGLRLKTPIGLTVGPDGVIYVADVGLQKVLSYSPNGELKGSYGKPGELTNPTQPAVSPDGTKLFVADSKGQKIVIFDLKSGKLLSSWGKQGDREGEFSFPTSIVFGQDGNLFVIDQINARIEVFTPDGAFVDVLGGRGISAGSFVRPKCIAVDEAGLIYVTDAAFSNIQIFDAEFQPLTFVGDAGKGPGAFQNIQGVAVRGDQIAAVDQLNRRVQIFRFLGPKAGD